MLVKPKVLCRGRGSSRLFHVLVVELWCNVSRHATPIHPPTEQSQAMFGDTVIVTTVVGIPESDDEDAVETERLEKELLEEKKRKRAERIESGRGPPGAIGRGYRAGRGGVAGEGEGVKEERWSLAAVQKRLAAKMPPKSRKGSAKKSEAAGIEKGKKGKKGKKQAAAGRGGASASALMDKARGSMPRAELGKGKGKKRKK